MTEYETLYKKYSADLERITQADLPIFAGVSSGTQEAIVFGGAIVAALALFRSL